MERTRVTYLRVAATTGAGALVVLLDAMAGQPKFVTIDGAVLTLFSALFLFACVKLLSNKKPS